jgi:hypothetical protein
MGERAKTNYTHTLFIHPKFILIMKVQGCSKIAQHKKMEHGSRTGVIWIRKQGKPWPGNMLKSHRNRRRQRRKRTNTTNC